MTIRDAIHPGAEEERAWHALEAAAVVEALKTNPERGLSHEDVEARLAQYGPNMVSKGRHRSLLGMFFSQFTDPLVVALLGAAIVTFLLRDYIDTGVILAVVLINAIIGFVQEERAETAIESLSKMLTPESVVIRDGHTSRISSEYVVPGDIVVLQGGDKAPADIRLISARNLQMDESILTGESAPVSKTSRPVELADPVSDRKCMAYSGSLVTAGAGNGVVVATGDATELGKISSLIAAAPKIATPLTRTLAKFGRLLSLAIIGVAVATFSVGTLLGRSPDVMFNAAVAIAVAMIPEGLPAIVTIVLAVGVKRMADRNAIIRTLPSVETLGSVTVICSDKTGTLTANEMTVSHVFAGGNDYEFGGIGYNPYGNSVVPIDTDDSELQNEAFIECLRCGLLCNDSDLSHKNGEWSPEGDPTEVALIVSARKGGLDPDEERLKHSRIDVVPFESSNMYMATLNENSGGRRVIYVKGSIERILDMCSNQLVGHEEQPLESQRIQDRANDLALQGFRVLAFARREVPSDVESTSDDDLSGLTFLGLQAMSDPARPEVIAAVRECASAGIEVKMITGDHVATARAIARNINIGGADPKAVTGSELSALEGEELDEAACSASVFARVAPEQKYRLVESLQGKGETAAMTGDGVNDAPALKKADIGVAMGKAGSEVAKDASDMVLTDDNFASIVAAVEEGRTVFSNLLKSLAFILPTNAGEGLIIIVALMSGYALPVTPVQILWINTVTAVTLALPLAFEPKEPGLMDLPPRDLNAPLLSPALIQRIVVVGVFMVISGFAVFVFERQAGLPIAQARTAAVTTIVAIEMFYLFVARSERVSVLQLGLFSNPYVWIGVPLVIILQLAFIYTPVLNFLFNSAPLPGATWSHIILASFPVTLIVSLEKAVRRRLS